MNTELAAEYAKVKDGKKEEDIFQFITKNFNDFQMTDLSEKLKNICKSIDPHMKKLQERGSGLSLKHILH